MPRKYLVLLIVLAIVAIAFHTIRTVTRERPQAHTSQHEEQVGATVAELIVADRPPAETTILYLFPRNHELYGQRAEALREELEEQDATVNELWAQEEGLYDDDDYTASIDAALASYAETRTLVIVAVGGVTHANVSQPLRDFVNGGGKLYLIGSTSEGAPLVQMAQLGYATILARRTTWLKDAEPSPALADAPEYVRAKYTIIRKKDS